MRYPVKIILFFFLFKAISCFTQEGFLPGYVITNKGDTLKGKIKDRKFMNGTSSWQKIDFIDSAAKKYKFDPEEIKEYGRKGRTKYRTLVIGVESKKTFAEVQEEGAIILYANNLGTWGGTGTAVLVKTTEKGPKERVEFFLQKRNLPNSLMQWRPGDYKKTAQVFFKDDEELLKKVEEEILKEGDIREVVKKYNAKK